MSRYTRRVGLLICLVAAFFFLLAANLVDAVENAACELGCDLAALWDEFITDWRQS